ncbi:MAG: bifunctional nuclease family protein [Candidatus Aureabacteria bacterium]|nr:bifunctional nuclease family protein [Candidatus Auribacterota bacterium]
MLVKVDIKRIVATPETWAIFLGNGDKTFVLYVGPGVGMALSMSLEGVSKVRPLTHDLITSIFAGLGVRVERVVINDLKGVTFYARLFLREESERGKRVVELDARPSDCLVLAKQNGAPIYIDQHVLNQVEDVSNMLDAGEEGHGEGHEDT